MSESSYPNLSEKSALNALVRFQNVKYKMQEVSPAKSFLKTFTNYLDFSKVNQSQVKVMAFK